MPLFASGDGLGGLLVLFVIGLIGWGIFQIYMLINHPEAWRAMREDKRTQQRERFQQLTGAAGLASKFFFRR